jgi:putative transcriptional regulator
MNIEKDQHSNQRPQHTPADYSECQQGLADHFLIAMPGLNAGIFANSVTYICEHNEQGAMGIVINHPLDLSLGEIFEHLDIEGIDKPHHEAILAGGPLQMDRGFILHRRSPHQWQSTRNISKHISLTSSQDILADIAHNQGPKDSIIALGYAGWGAGQLEEELADNAWLTTRADSDIIFNTPIELRAKAAAASIGVDLNLISTQVGHA